MGNINYDDILSRLSRIRQDNLRRQDNRKAEVYARIPLIKEIDDAIAHARELIAAEEEAKGAKAA